jgi:hypothetical protein
MKTKMLTDFADTIREYKKMLTMAIVFRLMHHLYKNHSR